MVFLMFPEGWDFFYYPKMAFEAELKAREYSKGEK